MTDEPTPCPYSPVIAGVKFSCSRSYGHSGPHCFRNEAPDFDHIAAELTRERERREAAERKAEHREQMYSQRKALLRDLQQSAMREQARAEAAEADAKRNWSMLLEARTMILQSFPDSLRLEKRKNLLSRIDAAIAAAREEK